MDAELTPREVDLLQNCPWCRYPLRGMPVEHPCPECGRLTDRRGCIFQNFRSASNLLFNLFAAGASVFVGIQILGAFEEASVPQAFYAAGLLSLLLAAIYRHRRRRQIFVCAGPGVVAVCDRRSGKIETYPTAWIRLARSEKNGTLVLVLPDRLVTVDSFRRAPAVLCHCVQHINQLLQEIHHDGPGERGCPRRDPRILIEGMAGYIAPGRQGYRFHP